MSTQHLEELRSALHLVDDHQAAQRLEHQHGGLELRLDPGVLEVEEGRGTGRDIPSLGCT